MPKLRRISGKDLVKILLQEGFVEIRQKGSHKRLAKKTGDASYSVTVPVHDELDRGTLRSILRAIESCVERAKIKKIFYTS